MNNYKKEYLIISEQDKNIGMIKEIKNDARYKRAYDATIEEFAYLVTQTDFFQGRFSSHFFRTGDIYALIAEENTEIFQQINPILFEQVYRFGKLDKESMFYIVNNLSVYQMRYFPKRLLRTFDLEALNIIKKRFFNCMDVDYYTLEIYHDKEINNRTIYYFKKETTLGDFVTKIYVREKQNNSYSGANNSHKVDLSKAIIRASEICSYLDITLDYFAHNYNRILLKLKLIPNGKQNKKDYSTASFINSLKECYTGDKTKMEIADRLYKVDDLIADYNISKRIIQYYARTGKLNYYRISDKIIRVSKKDINELFEKELFEKIILKQYSEKMILKQSSTSKRYRTIQGNLEDYIEINDFLNYIRRGNEQTEGERLGRAVLLKCLKENCSLYKKEKKEYLKKDEILDYLSSIYGFYDTEDKQVLFEPLPIRLSWAELSTLYHYEKCCKIFAQRSGYSNTYAVVLLRNYLGTEMLPYIRVSKKTIFIRKDDLDEFCKKITNARSK